MKFIDRNYNLNGSYQPTIKRFADLEGPDFYPTPAWATHALLDNESFEGDIWECACGDGSMAEILKLTKNKVIATDLYDREYGRSNVDFLKSKKTVSNIVTNPPFHSAELFVSKGLELAKNKFVLLLRLAFLESAYRANTIFLKNPPSRVWVFSERITFYPKNAEKKGSGTTAYAWFVWDKAHRGQTELRWLRPGYKSKY
jgi:hypothetical protein